MSQQTRTYIYGIIIAAVPILVAFGFVAEDQAQLWLTLAAAILGLGGNVLAKPNSNPKKVDVTPKAGPAAKRIPGT